MPTYEYACSACANEWEAEQSIKADALKECPRCHKQTARRQISKGAGFILKGSGWYSDLYSSPSNKKSPDSAASSEGTSSTSASSSTEKSDGKASEKSSSEKASSEKASSETSSGDKPTSSGSKPAPPAAA